MAIRVACKNASCSEAFVLSDDSLWQRAMCPACGEKQMARPFEFSCSDAACGRFLPYNKETAGKRVKCPDCEAITRAPAPLATMANRPAVAKPPAGEGAPAQQKTKPMRLSRRRSRLARARRPSRPFFATVVALCVVAAAFAELLLVSDRFYPWHELAKPIEMAGRFSQALLRESSPLAPFDRAALIALGAADLLVILFLFGFLARSNVIRWLAVLVCLGGVVLSGFCSEIILAAGWGALRAVMVAFLLLPGTGRWVGWRESVAREPEA